MGKPSHAVDVIVFNWFGGTNLRVHLVAAYYAVDKRLYTVHFRGTVGHSPSDVAIWQLYVSNYTKNLVARPVIFSQYLVS